ncbi:MAG TPA: hypothetical protein ENN60_02135 [archaeon]|nr:hypothetical protein [archaeon]
MTEAIENPLYTYFQAIGLVIALVATISLLTGGNVFGNMSETLLKSVTDGIRGMVEKLVSAAV